MKYLSVSTAVAVGPRKLVEIPLYSLIICLNDHTGFFVITRTCLENWPAFLESGSSG